VMTSMLTRSFASEDTPAEDPQDGNPFVSVIDVGLVGTTQDIRITLDLGHADTSEISVTVISPSGTELLLHDRGEGVNLSLTYPDDAEPAGGSIELLNGEPLEGTWSLQIVDPVAGNRSALNGWSISDTFMSEEQLDVLGDVDMHDNRLFNLADPEGETDAVSLGYLDGSLAEQNAALREEMDDLRAEVEALVERVEHQGVVIRWNVFDVYHAAWSANNDSNMFGGIHPSHWDGGRYADQMSSDKEILRTLFTRRAYAKSNATLVAEAHTTYATTNASRWAVALFRIRNTSDEALNWPVSWYYTCGQWGGYASIARNGERIWSDTNNRRHQDTVNISIPANRISTVIFVSSDYYWTSYGNTYHWLLNLHFYNNSLDLPAGLEYVDDLDTAEGGWDQ